MDDRQIVHRIEIINEHMVEVFHNFQEVCDPVQTNVNIFIACFMTSYAWLKLYDALDTLKERVLYMDTGSIIYTKKPTETSIPVGNYLDEFEFVAAEPKNYTYNTFQGKQTCKVRGFTLNEWGQKILNFKSMKDLVLNEILQPEDDQCTLTLQNAHKIKTIQTVSQDKKYKIVFDKRVINPDTFQSFPYGYKCISTPWFPTTASWMKLILILILNFTIVNSTIKTLR